MTNNPWFENVVSGLIVAVLIAIISFFLKNGRPYSAHLTAIVIATVIFSFGNFLEPVTQAILDNDPIRWGALIKLRYGSPGLFVLILLTGGLFPGILTGFFVAKGSSLVQRMKLGAFWAPISLSIFDAIYFVIARAITPEGRHHLIELGDFTFSLVSNLVGGIPGGVIIGLLVHLALTRRLLPE